MSEHVVMMILSLVRNYIPSYQWVVKGRMEHRGLRVSVVRPRRDAGGNGRCRQDGSAVLRRLKPFEVGLHYTDRHRLPEEVEQELGVTFHPDAESMVPHCDVVTINAPLHPETEHLFDDNDLEDEAGRVHRQHGAGRSATAMRLPGHWKADSWPATRATCGSLQPAPQDHPWRTMPNHGMTPHVSGSSLSAQGRATRREHGETEAGSSTGRSARST